jgi:hypothetical protein
VSNTQSEIEVTRLISIISIPKKEGTFPFFVLQGLRAIMLPMFVLLTVETLNVRNIFGFRSAQSHHLSLPLTHTLRLALGTLLNLFPGRTDRKIIPKSFVHVLLGSLKQT